MSTSGNEVIGEILAGASSEVVDQLADLLQGKSILTYVDSSVIYPQIKDNPSSIYSFLLVCGYLKITGSDKAFGLGNLCQVALPKDVYKRQGRHRRVVRYLPVDEHDTGLQLYRQHRHRHAGDLI